jgi:oxygen-independent coproporphyrinogen III oxidase
LSELIAVFKLYFTVAEQLEITLECNPDDCTLEHLQAWKEAGVSRLSIGIQSFQEMQLGWMNRTHSAKEGLEAVKRAKAVGFDALTVDLMYGLPELSLADWKIQLDAVLELDVPHISAYCLTIEEKTALATWVKSGKIHPPTADQQSEQFELLVATLAEHGFEQYEISNFARNEQYSKHNTAYWKGKPYVGIGPSAHGYDLRTRYWNVANNQQYMRAIGEGVLPETVEVLSERDRFNEELLVGLRTKWGASKQNLFSVRDPEEDWKKIVNSYELSGDLLETSTHFVLTQKGRLLADAIASDLFWV